MHQHFVMLFCVSLLSKVDSAYVTLNSKKSYNEVLDLKLVLVFLIFILCICRHPPFKIIFRFFITI